MRCLFWANAIRPYTLAAGFVLAMVFTFSCSSGGGGGNDPGGDDSSSSVGGVVGVSSSSSAGGGKNRSSSSSDDVGLSSSVENAIVSSSSGEATISSSSSDNVVSSSSAGNVIVSSSSSDNVALSSSAGNVISSSSDAIVSSSSVNNVVSSSSLGNVIVSSSSSDNVASSSSVVEIPKCGSVEYNPSTEQCCGSGKYTLATQFCYDNSKVVNLCGNRTEHYDPDLYECKPSINVNGIYLKNKPKDSAGKEYEAVLIGTQTWMAENLNYNASGSRCYGDNTGGDSQNRCDTYGRLYNWSTAMGGVCPAGWHLPSDAEWTALTNFVGSSTAGTKLRANSTLWSTNTGTDDFGFSALPGGYGNSGGRFYDVGNIGYWWSATEDFASYAYNRDISYNNAVVGRDYNDNSYLYSVRCVQDSP